MDQALRLHREHPKNHPSKHQQDRARKQDCAHRALYFDERKRKRSDNCGGRQPNKSCVNRGRKAHAQGKTVPFLQGGDRSHLSNRTRQQQ
jgi:hypothetical protein